jgi:phosphate-selective porin OprO/OprP
MKLNWAAWLIVIAGAHLGVPMLPAQDASTAEIIKQLQKRIEELEQKVQGLESSKGNAQLPTNNPQSSQRIEELDQKVKVLERKRELDKEAATENAKSLPTVSLGSNGLIIRSADTNFLMNLHGYAQVDGRFYLNEHNPANDTFLLRRVRPIIEGTVFDRFD